MNWKKRLFKESSLYVILDKDTCKNIFKVAVKIRDSGLNIVQLREKNTAKKAILKDARRLKSLFGNGQGVLIMNDHADIAKLIKADGVHLGQDDLPIKEARKILGKDKIIGISCHSLRQALVAQKNGADYIGIGPVFKTPTKPGLKPIGLGALKSINKKIRIPAFAIGGINKGNLSRVLSAGVSKIAVCRQICSVKDVPGSIKKIKGILNDAN